MNKKVQTMTALAALCAAAVAMTACAGLARAPSKPKQATELLDWKGAAFGTAVPDWVMEAQQSDLHIQNLEQFKDQACFVVSREEPTNKDFAITWVGNAANGAAEIARIISTTVNAAAESQIAAKSGGDAAKRVANEMRDVMSNASFKGFRRAADFWALQKNRATKQESYVAFSLWTIPNTELDLQLAAQYENIIANNKALSAAEQAIYKEIISDIRKRGITNVK